ncbi:hypothetical protein DPMN_047081 [Dreissena polymorpha]|uniref:Uncharacterized protein n=1 Tax=Dreissena polymorpha TaxID=45954 RepID=A0A9D4D8W5_DREPO|nr:hypothetical protein DPMN_047081 [Dreissena polymorpha]
MSVSRRTAYLPHHGDRLVVRSRNDNSAWRLESPIATQCNDFHDCSGHVIWKFCACLSDIEREIRLLRRPYQCLGCRDRQEDLKVNTITRLNDKKDYDTSRPVNRGLKYDSSQIYDTSRSVNRSNCKHNKGLKYDTSRPVNRGLKYATSRPVNRSTCKQSRGLKYDTSRPVNRYDTSRPLNRYGLKYDTIRTVSRGLKYDMCRIYDARQPVNRFPLWYFHTHGNAPPPE